MGSGPNWTVWDPFEALEGSGSRTQAAGPARGPGAGPFGRGKPKVFKTVVFAQKKAIFKSFQTCFGTKTPKTAMLGYQMGAIWAQNAHSRVFHNGKKKLGVPGF